MIPLNLRQQIMIELQVLIDDFKTASDDQDDLDAMVCLMAVAARTEADAKMFCRDTLVGAERNMYGYPNNVIPLKDPLL